MGILEIIGSLFKLLVMMMGKKPKEEDEGLKPETPVEEISEDVPEETEAEIEESSELDTPES